MNEVIDRTETVKTVVSLLAVVRHGELGYRVLMRDGLNLANDGDSTYEYCAHLVEKIVAHIPDGGSVAILGGGFGVLPGLLGNAYSMRVYEAEVACKQFIPNRCKFIPGRWQDTLTGTYDVIVVDTGEAGDTPDLSSHLKRGGIVLGAS